MTDIVVDEVYDRPATYEEATDDGTRVVYRASSFGYCIGALVRSRLGMTASPPPDLMLERFQEGHDWEREVLARGLGVDWVEVQKDSELQRLGRVVEAAGGVKQVECEVSWANGTRVVRVHPDAIVRRGADKKLYVCEVKFLHRDRLVKMASAELADMRAVLGDQYAWQASIEMLATGLPMLYVVGAKDVKVTKDSREVIGVGEVLTLEWTEPAFSMRDVKMRVAEVEGWVARGEMPSCPVPFDYPCGFWWDHEEREKDELTDEVLVHLVEGYARAKSKEEAHKDEAERIKADIDARLVEIEEDGGRCGGWEIARTQARKGNVSWSSWAKAVKKQHPEVADVSEDEFRGKEIEGGIRMTKVKGDG